MSGLRFSSTAFDLGLKIFAFWAQGLPPSKEPRENDDFFGIARGRAMLFFLIGTTIILGGITGFADFSQGAFFRGLGGQIMQGALSIGCFTLSAAAFWRFGWKIGLLNLFFAIIAANVRLIRE
jgi:hypothetical protein